MTNIWWSKRNHKLDNFYLDITFWLHLFLQLGHFLPAALCCFVGNAGKVSQIYEKLWRGLVLKTSTFKSVQLESITLLLNVNRHNGNFTKQNHLFVTSKTAQGPLSIRVQITFKVRPERKARLLCDDSLQSSLHYLPDNEFQSYCHVLQASSTECYTAKKYDFSPLEQRWKKEKEHRLLFDFLLVIIHKNIILL